ncbi:hypothetical protein NDA03_08285 [Trichocoleus sp. Lan]|uniref:hypothetical protein n=1 Tax=Trichocoleus sp. Lan TaxID=2933927 RepID=UPI003298F8F8
MIKLSAVVTTTSAIALKTPAKRSLPALMPLSRMDAAAIVYAIAPPPHVIFNELLIQLA